MSAVKQTCGAFSKTTRRFVAKTELEILKRLARGVNTPRSLAMYLLAEAGEIDQLVSMDISAKDYTDSFTFSGDYLVTKILSKSTAQKTSFNRKESADKKAFESDQRCVETNDRLRDFRFGTSAPEDITYILYRARLWIQKILGPLGKSQLETIEDHMNFGPGATTQVTGVVTHGRKFSLKVLDTTPDLLSFGVFCLPELWKTTVEGFNLCDSSRKQYVPKNAKTDRIIRIEPTLNIYFQKGIGAYVRKRLSKFGLDLSTQEWNQFLASKAEDWNLTTLDLESASDSVSVELVKFLLPKQWYDLFHICRTHFSDNKTLEMWSTMGNGYTFELESLIFYALLLSTLDYHGHPEEISRCAVYGDDIIIPSPYLDSLVRTLNFSGFKVNDEKSFGKGAFHESCGADYFQGQNVRPIYLREENYGQERDRLFYLYGNLLRRWSFSRNGCNTFDGRCLPAWIYCFTAVPSSRRCYVPNWDYATGGFVEGWEKISTLTGAIFVDRRGELRLANKRPSVSFIREWRGYGFAILDRKPISKLVSMSGSYISSLLQGSDFTQGREALRGRTKDAAFSPRYTNHWPFYGPWVGTQGDHLTVA